MSRKFSLMLSLTCALLLVACGGSDTSNSNTANTSNASNANRATTTNTSTTTPPTTSNTTASTTGDKIGVAECDDYLTKYEACVSGKVPEAARAQYNSTLQETRRQWRNLASNPQTKGTLAAACRIATEQARQTMKSFGCDF